MNPCAPGSTFDEGNRPAAPVLDGVATVTWPYATGSARVTVHRIPRVTFGTVTAPELVSQSVVPVTNGQAVQVDLGPVEDGEAYTVTVAPPQFNRPAGGSGP